jgi:uncharacterized membrane protein
MKVIIPNLLLIGGLSVLMSVFRPLVSGNSAYIYMNWNLFLGLIPLLFAWLYYQQKSSKVLMVLYFLLWLFFLPNAPYMVTDLIHIDTIGPSHMSWYDGLMLFGYAWVGILVWLHTVSMVYQRLPYRSFIPLVSLFTAFGMYLGRYIRFNTWDIAIYLKDVLNTAGNILIRPLDHEPFLMFTTIFWIFLMCIYLGYSRLHSINQDR